MVAADIVIAVVWVGLAGVRTRALAVAVILGIL
jgi:hypothetical protein